MEAVGVADGRGTFSSAGGRISIRRQVGRLIRCRRSLCAALLTRSEGPPAAGHAASDATLCLRTALTRAAQLSERLEMAGATEALKQSLAPHVTRFKLEVVELLDDAEERAKLHAALDRLERDIVDCIDRHAEYVEATPAFPEQSEMERQLLGLVDAFQADFRRSFAGGREGHVT